MTINTSRTFAESMRVSDLEAAANRSLADEDAIYDAAVASAHAHFADICTHAALLKQATERYLANRAAYAAAHLAR